MKYYEQYKQFLQEDIIDFLLDTSKSLVGASSKVALSGSKAGSKQILSKGKEFKKELKVSIADIIEFSKAKHKYDYNQCSEIEHPKYRYDCKRRVLKDKINELDKSKKYCRFNGDPKLCIVRLVEEISEMRLQIAKYDKAITDINIEELKLKNARLPDRDTYYGNEYVQDKEF